MSALENMDAVELRAGMESATDGALVFADRLAERVLASATDVELVAFAAAYLDLRRVQKSFRRRLKIELAG